VNVRVISIAALAPPQPAFAAPCNGCGVCCLAEPCPLGMLVSLRRHGRCAALSWDESAAHYRCGMVTAPAAVLGLGSSRPARWLARGLSGLALRWIAAAEGCDSSASADR